MRDTGGAIHPEAKFLSNCEPMKSAKLCASQIRWWNRHRTGTPIPKKENKQEKSSDRSQVCPKSNRAN